MKLIMLSLVTLLYPPFECQAGRPIAIRTALLLHGIDLTGCWKPQRLCSLLACFHHKVAADLEHPWREYPDPKVPDCGLSSAAEVHLRQGWCVQRCIPQILVVINDFLNYCNLSIILNLLVFLGALASTIFVNPTGYFLYFRWFFLQTLKIVTIPVDQ